jgi:hypothetical protein
VDRVTAVLGLAAGILLVTAGMAVVHAATPAALNPAERILLAALNCAAAGLVVAAVVIAE